MKGEYKLKANRRVSDSKDLDDLPRVLFIGGTRYSYPLDETHRKKFYVLASVSKNYVFAYSMGMKFQTFTDGANFYLIPSKMPRIIRYPFFLFLAFYMIIYVAFKYNVKINICQSPYEALSSIIVKTILKIFCKHISVIIEIHGDWESAPKLYLVPKLKLVSRILGKLGNIISDFVLKRSDVIRTISFFTIEKLSHKGISKPIIKFPAYTDIELFCRCSNNLQEFSLPYNNYVLYAGMLIYLKGIHVLIESMARVVERYEQQLLLIAGSGEYYKELEKLVYDRKLENNVVFLGHLDQRTLALYMQNCMVLVLPSLSEGLGRVLIEAMACGKPVIGTNVGGIPELIKDGENGFLISPNEPYILADRIIYLIQNPDIAIKMGANGKKLVYDIFSNEKYLIKFRELIRVATSSL